MPERRTPYLLSLSEQRQSVYMLPEPVELGRHLVEMLNDTTIIVVKRTQWDAMVQLSREEAYRLMVTLQSWFASDEQ